MSKRSSRDSQGSKVLLDTSFILPILGFETSDRVMKAFQKLSSHELHYNEISILEALWKIVKIIEGTEEQLERIKEGIRSLKGTIKHVSINDEAVENAIRMYKLGHRDMIDNLLYSIAISNNLKLLTVDDALIEFIEEHGFSKDNVTTPEKLT